MPARFLAAIALCLLPASAFATDGVIELNHAKALAGDPTLFPPDAAGYPIEIRNPGSYRLTSDLAVTPGANGILLMAANVHIDRTASPCADRRDAFRARARRRLGALGSSTTPAAVAFSSRCGMAESPASARAAFVCETARASRTCACSRARSTGSS